MRAITRKTKRGQVAVDKLAKVWLKDGTERWVLIHIEIQSQVEPDFPQRMVRYYFRGRDLFPDRSFACLAVLGDDNAGWKPDSYAESFWQTGFEFRFRVVKLKDYEDRLEELERNANPFARFVLAHLKTIATQGDYETRLQWKLRIIQGLHDLGVSDAEVGQLSHDFDWLMTLPDTLANRYHKTMFRFEEDRGMTHISTSERIGRREGRKEGLLEGELKGQLTEARTSILEILEAQFGSVPPDLVSRVTQLNDLDRLRRLRKLLINGIPLADFEQVLDSI